MKMSDLYTVALSNGDLATGALDALRAAYPYPWQMRGEPFPAVHLAWLTQHSLYFVEFDTKSVGMTLKHFDNRADAEAFRDEVLAMDETDFRKRFLGWTD